MNEIITGWDIYWVMQMSAIRGTVVALTVILGVYLFLIGLVSGVAEDLFMTSKKFTKIFIICCAIWLLLLIIAALMPNTKTLAAAYVLPPIINNEQVQKIPIELLEPLGLTNEVLKKKLKESVEE